MTVEKQHPYWDSSTRPELRRYRVGIGQFRAPADVYKLFVPDAYKSAVRWPFWRLRLSWWFFRLIWFKRIPR